jgi:hypothetical protein
MPLTASAQIPGRFIALCDRCRAPIALEIEAIDLPAARARLIASGWLEGALGSRGRDRIVWRCPVCAPTRARVQAAKHPT